MPAWLLPGRRGRGHRCRGLRGDAMGNNPDDDPIPRSALSASRLDRPREPGAGRSPGSECGPSRETPEPGKTPTTWWLSPLVANPIYSVRSQQSVDSGDLLTCEFLNGGLCAGTIVETPNGPVEAGADIPAVFLSKTLFTSNDDAEARTEAWTALCDRLSDIRVAALAAGYIGVAGRPGVHDR